MASNDRCFLVFMPLSYSLPLRIGRNDGTSFSRLGYKNTVASLWGMLSHSLIPCSVGNKLPCCKLFYGEVHVVKN